jgi:ketosteroid isomerase-like protein
MSQQLDGTPASTGAGGGTATVEETERRRLRALVTADIPAARALHARDCRVVDPRGGTHSGHDYLEALAAGAVDYGRFEPVSDIDVLLSGDLAVAVYRSRIDVEVQGLAPQSLEAWHTNCYRRARDSGNWELVWAQETAVATG